MFEVAKTRESVSNNVVVAYYGKNGTVYAWNGYSDEIIGKAGGGGYDKIGSALEQAVTFLTGYQFKTNGAAGVNAIMDEAKRVGIILNIIV